MRDARVFVDANTLLDSHDGRVPDKHETAREWLRLLIVRAMSVTNLQVLNECASVMLRKRWFGSAEAVYEIVDGFRPLGASPMTWVEVERARSLREQTGYSWWDCLLVASVLELGCTHFPSEDLQDGRSIEGLTILSPFAHSPSEILVQDHPLR